MLAVVPSTIRSELWLAPLVPLIPTVPIFTVPPPVRVRTVPFLINPPVKFKVPPPILIEASVATVIAPA